MTTEQLLFRLVDALHRKDTEQDGNWGYPSFHQELREIKKSLVEIIEKGKNENT